MHDDDTTGTDDGAADIELERHLRDAVRITPEALEEEFVRLPSDMAYWNERYANAVDDHLKAKAHTKFVRADVYKNTRDAASVSGAKLSEAYVDAAVETSLEVRTAVDIERTGEVAAVRLKGIVETIRSKRDMIIQIGAHHRAEMERDPVIRDRMRGARMMHGGGAG